MILADRKSLGDEATRRPGLAAPTWTSDVARPSDVIRVPAPAWSRLLARAGFLRAARAFARAPALGPRRPNFATAIARGVPLAPAVALALAFTACAPAASSRATVAPPPTAAATSTLAAPVFPGAEWERIERPEDVGWSSEGLERVRERLSTLATTGMMAVVGGRVLFEYGDVETVSYVASVRKSILSMLYGIYVERGVIDLNRTLAELGIDDIGGLTDQEKQAAGAPLPAARASPGLQEARRVLPLQQLGLQRPGHDLRAGDREEHLRCPRGGTRPPPRDARLRPLAPPPHRRRQQVDPPRLPHAPVDAGHGAD